jgi:hypothetical protein
MKKDIIILWIASIIITFLIGYALSILSKNYPVSGTIGIEGQKVSYRFEKVHYGLEDLSVLIRSDLKGLSGKLFWKSENDPSWISENMHYESDLALSAKLPALVPNNKLLYYAELFYKNRSYLLPDNQKVEMKFYGKIPSTITFLQFLLFNLGLLLIVRVGLEFFNKQEKIKKYEIFIGIIFITLTVLINPLYISYKYGFINSSIPSINKLFPFRELSITSIWIVAVILTFNLKKYKWVPVMASIISIIILVIFN